MTVFKEGPFIDYSTASMLNVIDEQSSRISKLKSTPAMTTDIDRQKLRELCELATPGPWESTVCDDGLMMVATTGDTICFGDPNHKEPDDTANGDFIAAARTALPVLLDLTDAQAAKIAELDVALAQEHANAMSMTRVQNEMYDQQTKAFETIVAERDQLRKQVEGQFVAGMRGAVNVIKGIVIWDGPDADAQENAFDEASSAILSAASALEQKDQG